VPLDKFRRPSGGNAEDGLSAMISSEYLCVYNNKDLVGLCAQRIKCEINFPVQINGIVVDETKRSFNVRCTRIYNIRTYVLLYTENIKAFPNGALVGSRI